MTDNSTINYLAKNSDFSNLHFCAENKIDYTINNNDVIIYYKDLQVYTNFKDYCYVNPDNEIINMKLLLLTNFNIINILNILNNNNEFPIVNVTLYNDVYNFFHIYNEKSKVNIDYNLIDKNSLSYKETNLINIKIPKELLFNENKIREILLCEVKKINSNFEH